MSLLYIIYTHNRGAILSECLNSLFSKNDTKPDRVVIIDDGSTEILKQNLFTFSLQNKNTPIDFISINKNIGYGTSAEIGIKLAEVYNYKYTFFIESDYVFNKNSIDTVLDIFENTEYGKHAVGFSGYDNPDFYKSHQTGEVFKDIIINDCGEDNLNRDILYKPFEINTKYGKKQLELVSNSCGTMYFNWHKINAIKQEFPLEYNVWVEKTTDKHKSKRNLNDGMMSHGISWLWTKWAEKNAIDTNKFAALLNIKPSVANHINGGGINGYIVPEGQSFVGSPTYNEG